MRLKPTGVELALDLTEHKKETINDTGAYQSTGQNGWEGIFEKVYRSWAVCVEWFIRKVAFARAKFVNGKMSSYLPVGGHVLDFGCGAGHIGALMKTCESRQATRHVTLLNVKPPTGYFGQWLFNGPCASALAEIRGLSYEKIKAGDLLPFPGRTFDAVLLAFVLHHAKHPERVLAEAVRVSKGRIIVFEDIPNSRRQTLWSRISDMIINLEIAGPHNNRTRQEWVMIFEGFGLNVVYQDSWVGTMFWGLLRFPNTLFVLEREVNA